MNIVKNNKNTTFKNIPVGDIFGQDKNIMIRMTTGCSTNNVFSFTNNRTETISSESAVVQILNAELILG